MIRPVQTLIYISTWKKCICLFRVPRYTYRKYDITDYRQKNITVSFDFSFLYS